jgi:CubicO group peptidase (beta-lactamase class C family)
MPPPLPDLAAAIRTLNLAVADKATPGAAFGLLLDARESTAAVGHLDFTAHSPAATPTSLYDLASLTKVVATASAAMLLHDRSALDLDAPLASILPAFNPAADALRSRVTLRHLLTHSSGLPAHQYLYRTCRTRDQAIAACLSMPLTNAPGLVSDYSDPGFILLGLALETISAEPLDRFCAREIFTPLGMADTLFNPPAALLPRIAPAGPDSGLRTDASGVPAPIHGQVHDENAALLGGVAGHAGLFSTVPDLLRFARCILSGGLTSNNKRLFRADTISLFTTRAATPPGTSRALAWDTPTPPSSSGTRFSPHSVGHLGYTGCSLWLDLDRSLAVVLLLNRTCRPADGPPAEKEPIRGLRPAFHDALLAALPTAV